MKYTVYYNELPTYSINWWDMDYSKTFENGKEATNFAKRMENEGYITEIVDESNNAIY